MAGFEVRPPAFRLGPGDLAGDDGSATDESCGESKEFMSMVSIANGAAPTGQVRRGETIRGEFCVRRSARKLKDEKSRQEGKNVLCQTSPAGTDRMRIVSLLKGSGEG